MQSERFKYFFNSMALSTASLKKLGSPFNITFRYTHLYYAPINYIIYIKMIHAYYDGKLPTGSTND